MALDIDALINAAAADPRHFAVPITYVLAAGAPITGMSGIFDDAFEDVRIATDGTQLTTVSPALGVQLSSFPAGIVPAQGDQVTVAGNTYYVSDVRTDGLGWAQLVLKLVSG